MESAFILAAEDDDFTRDMLDTILGSTGFKFDLAVDGNDAVSKFKGKNGGYTLVLLDLQMPNKDGCSAAKEIRQIESSSGWKKYDDAKTKGTVVSAGMDGLVKKPLKKDVVKGLM